uniref:Uncharacterized protein n=1 Tax=mine drainage metagenome TaxID=410659 RepID=E6QBM0_9ZZZZ
MIPESGSRKPVLALHDLLLFFVSYMIMLVYVSDSLEVWQDLAYTYAVGREAVGCPMLRFASPCSACCEEAS